MNDIFVFLSYGHDDCTNSIKTLYEQLSQEKDFSIWWDNKLEVSADWVEQIDENLNALINNKPKSCFIYFITPYSADTKRNNFCINEIVKVIGEGVNVVPIRLKDAPLPLLLGNIQWMDLTNIKIDANNEEFRNKIEELRKVVKNEKELLYDGKQSALVKKLEPFNFPLELKLHLQNYEKRQWLLDNVRDWIENSDSDEHILLILGGPGTGKTAFSIWISYSELSEQIAGWHLCSYADSRTGDMRNAVKSLAYYLSTRIPEYFQKLDIAKVNKFVDSVEYNAGTLFKELIITPLQDIESTKTMAILIDALDEAGDGDNNGLADILSQYASLLPVWLKIIITSRKVPAVTAYLSECSRIIDLDDSLYTANTSSDIERYIKNRIGTNPSYDGIIAESGNVFLYAQLLCDTILKYPDFVRGNLPKGLSTYYHRYMKRYLNNGSVNFEEHILPLLQLIITSYEPLRSKDLYGRLQHTCDWCRNYTVYRKKLNEFGPLLTEKNGFLYLFHKSLADWFLNDNLNKEFSVNRQDGLDEMIKWGKEVVQGGDLQSNNNIAIHFYKYLPQYMIENKNKDFVMFYLDISFWHRRIEVLKELGVTYILRQFLNELGLCSEETRGALFSDIHFVDILNLFDVDLFNTGVYANLYNIGYRIPIVEGMTDEHRLLAIRFYYINELYEKIECCRHILEEKYTDQIIEATVLNELGQNSRKLGELAESANFYKRSLEMNRRFNGTLDEYIYSILNLSRIFTMQCKFDEGKQLLHMATEEFDKGKWRTSIQGTNIEFAAQQLERGVRYVTLETELFSVRFNKEKCIEALEWADKVYSDYSKRDRYYANHLISKILFLIRTNALSGIEEIIDECKNNLPSTYDGIRLDCMHALYLLKKNDREGAYNIAKKQIEYLKDLRIHKIQLTEFFAICSYVENNENVALVPPEMRPWYNHILKLIQESLTKN